MKRRRCTKCGVNRQEKAYTSPRGRVCASCRRATRRRSSRSKHLSTTYEITEEEYAAILLLQGNACAGCGQPRNYNLSVDHDHKVEKEHGTRRSIRGLLCKRCNKVLRDVRDSTEILLRLARYLSNPPARGVLDGGDTDGDVAAHTT